MENKMILPCGSVLIAKSLEHAQRIHDRLKAKPAKDSKYALEGGKIVMAKRPVITKKKD